MALISAAIRVSFTRSRRLAFLINEDKGELDPETGEPIMLQFLHLPLFVPTFLAVLFRPLSFFRAYHQLVTTREESFWNLNAEREGDPYLGPVKFSALAITISNLILPFVLSLGIQVGAVSPDYAAFAEWAKENCKK